MANIGSLNELVSLGSGKYQLPSGKNNGFITSDNNVLNSQWYAEMTIELGSTWKWGTSEYGQGDDYFANVKLFRMWNPGSTKENCFVEYTGRNGGGMFKFVHENTSSSAKNWWSTKEGLSQVLKAGTKHRLQFDYKDPSVNGTNSRFRMWLNGELVLEASGFKSLTTGGLKRIFILGMQNEWGSGSGNVLTISNVVMSEGKTFEQFNGAAPVPSPSPVPTPTPSPTPTPAPAPIDTSIFALKTELDTLNVKLIALADQVTSLSEKFTALNTRLTENEILMEASEDRMDSLLAYLRDV